MVELGKHLPQLGMTINSNDNMCQYVDTATTLQSLFFTTIILFREEISACAAVHMRYVMHACDRVRSRILLPSMVERHSRLSR